MDLSSTIAPKSDQLNADDLISGPRTVTIVEVKAGTAEQPVNVVTQEFGPGRPFKPSKSMRRVLVEAWGRESSAYLGRSMTLYRDPSIRFGKEEVGGIRISHLSHIEKPLNIALTISKGKRAPFKVEVLPDAPDQVSIFHGAIQRATSMDELAGVWQEVVAAGLGGHLALVDRKNQMKEALTA